MGNDTTAMENDYENDSSQTHQPQIQFNVQGYQKKLDEINELKDCIHKMEFDATNMDSELKNKIKENKELKDKVDELRKISELVKECIEIEMANIIQDKFDEYHKKNNNIYIIGAGKSKIAFHIICWFTALVVLIVGIIGFMDIVLKILK